MSCGANLIDMGVKDQVSYPTSLPFPFKIHIDLHHTKQLNPPYHHSIDDASYSSIQ